MGVSVFDWLMQFVETIKGTCISIFEFMTTTVPIPFMNLEFTVYELVFGGGLVLLFTWAIVSFVIDVLP